MSKYKNITKYITISDPTGGFQFCCLINSRLEIVKDSVYFNVLNGEQSVFFLDNIEYLCRLYLDLKNKRLSVDVEEYYQLNESYYSRKALRKWFISLYEKAVKMGMFS